VFCSLWLESHCLVVMAGQPELSHSGVLAEWWLESHWLFGGGWAARIVTQCCFS